MGKFLNDYYSVVSPTGKTVLVKRVNHLWSNNPWTEIDNAKRYKKDSKGNFRIETFNSGAWAPFTDPSDEEYWDNYVRVIDKKIQGKPFQNFFGFTFNRNAPIQKNGGSINYLKFYK